jgi:hypothetical protein
VRLVEVDRAFRGAVPAGSEIRRAVLLENLTGSVVTVHVATVSCPCLEVSPKRVSIEPRGAAEIVLSARAADVGPEQWYTADLEVQIEAAEADPKPPSQRIQVPIGYAPDAAGFAEPRLVHLVVPAWQSSDTTIWVHRLDAGPVRGAIASVPGPWLQFAGFQANHDRTFEGSLILRSAAGPPAIHYGVVKVKDLGGVPFNDVFVSLRVAPALLAQPPGLVLQPDGTGRVPSATHVVQLRLASPGVTPARAVARETSRTKAIQFQLSRPDDKDELWNLSVEVRPQELSDHGRLLIDIVDDQDRLLVTVPVVWFSRPVTEVVSAALAKQE